MNLPNSVTMSRIVAVPLLIWMLSPRFPLHAAWGEQEIIAAVFFIAISITDGMDGFLARRRGQVTTMGMLLDPLADKLMISAGFITLIEFNPHIVKAWITILVIGREFLVTGLRSIASTEGFTIQASDLGKLKTVVQIFTVVAAILAHRWYVWNLGGFVIPVDWIATGAIYFMALVSLISAVDYFRAFWTKIDHASEGRRKASFVLSRNEKKSVPATNHLL